MADDTGAREVPILRHQQDMTPEEQRALLIRTLARVIGTIVVLVGVYAVIPFDGSESWTVALVGVLGVVVISTVAFVQIRSIAVAHLPSIKAVETIGLIVPLVIFWFAAIYYAQSASNPGSYSEELDHVGAAYFSMTTITTIGYGDIAPVSDSARIFVMMQMVINVLVVGLAIRLAMMAVRRNLEATPEQRAAFAAEHAAREANRRRRRRKRSEVDEDLADVGVGLDVTMGVGDPVEREP